jgi:heavy metal translocating P-type ATPase
MRQTQAGPRFTSARLLPAGSMGTISALVLRHILLVLPALGLVFGFSAYVYGNDRLARWIWIIATLPVLFALAIEIATSLRRSDFGLDIVAALSMTAALIFGEEAAAAIVALMYAGGKYLEGFAERRAGREMTALLERVPRNAARYRGGGLEEVDIESIEPGDRLMIKQGDVVPVDGTVSDGRARLDDATLTGESLPVEYGVGDAVMSGSANVGATFDLIATRRAAESTYAGIVRLVESARESKAPMTRLADRYAMGFLALTMILSGGAWIWSGDPIRAVAVLVIATPCPLILAVPVALVAGLSRGAKQGILIKGGKALETLARIQALVLDKTGTLTYGSAKIVSIHTSPGWYSDDLLRIAASLDQASKHVIAQAIVGEARRRGLELVAPRNVIETPGEGIEGNVNGRAILLGGPRFMSAKLKVSHTLSSEEKHQKGSVAVAIAIDQKLAGFILLADELRAEAATTLSDLRRLGISRIVLASGDSQEVTETVAAGLPFDLVRAELTPEQKILTVLSERKNGPVMMIGDGVNDAPALAAADVGMAMGARGSAASAEAADVVILVDRFDRVLPAIKIARRSRAIALQSIYAGMGLSIVGMIAAALGLIPPVQGALLQEGIDVAVILNALRALRTPAM